MATTKKNSKPAGLPGRDDDFGVFLEQREAERHRKTATTKSSGGKKPTTKK